MPSLMKKHGTWHARLVEWSAVTNWYSVDKYEVRDFGGLPTRSVFCRVPPALLLDFRIYDDGDRAVIYQGALHVGTENTFLDRAAGDFCQSGAVFFV